MSVSVVMSLRRSPAHCQRAAPIRPLMRLYALLIETSVELHSGPFDRSSVVL